MKTSKHRYRLKSLIWTNGQKTCLMIKRTGWNSINSLFQINIFRRNLTANAMFSLKTLRIMIFCTWTEPWLIPILTIRRRYLMKKWKISIITCMKTYVKSISPRNSCYSKDTRKCWRKLTRKNCKMPKSK